MALLTRVSRLFKADLHAVLDQLEEPVSLLKQSIREMEDALAEHEQHKKRLNLDRHDLDKRLRETETQTAELDSQLDFCFANGNDALARKLVRRKLEARKRAAQLEARLEAVADAIADTEATIEHERAELDHLRQKADCLAPESPAEAARGVPDNGLEVAEDEVEVAFLHEKQRREAS